MLVRINRLTHLYITFPQQQWWATSNVSLNVTTWNLVGPTSIVPFNTQYSYLRHAVSASNGPINAAYRRLGTGTVGGTAGAKNVLYVLITRTPSTVNLLAVNIMYYFSTSVYMQPLGSMPYVQRTRHIVWRENIQRFGRRGDEASILAPESVYLLHCTIPYWYLVDDSLQLTTPCPQGESDGVTLNIKFECFHYAPPKKKWERWWHHRDTLHTGWV